MLTRAMTVGFFILGLAGSMTYAVGDSEERQVHGAAIVDKDWTMDARKIIGAPEQDHKSIFSVSDKLYLNGGSENGFIPGMRCGIYRKGNTFKDPKTGSLGYEVKRLGTLKITKDIGKKNCTAMLMESAEPIEIGDLVKKD